MNIFLGILIAILVAILIDYVVYRITSARSERHIKEREQTNNENNDDVESDKEE